MCWKEKNGVIISRLDSCGTTKYIVSGWTEGMRGRRWEDGMWEETEMEVVTKIFLCNLYEFLLFQRNEISYKISFLLHKYGVLRKFFALWGKLLTHIHSYTHFILRSFSFKIWFMGFGNRIADVASFLQFWRKSFSRKCSCEPIVHIKPGVVSLFMLVLKELMKINRFLPFLLPN